MRVKLYKIRKYHTDRAERLKKAILSLGNRAYMSDYLLLDKELRKSLRTLEKVNRTMRSL